MYIVSLRPAAGIPSRHTVFVIINQLLLPPCTWKSPTPPGIPYIIDWCAWLGRNWPITWKYDHVSAVLNSAERGDNKRPCFEVPPNMNRLDWDKTKRLGCRPWFDDDIDVLNVEVGPSWCPLSSLAGGNHGFDVFDVNSETRAHKLCPGTFLDWTT